MEAVAGTPTKIDRGESLKSQTAIRCAKAAILLSSLKSPPIDRRLGVGVEIEDISEKEMLKKEIGDLKLAVAVERLKNKKMKLCGLAELVLQLVLLFALSIFIFMIGSENAIENLKDDDWFIFVFIF